MFKYTSGTVIAGVKGYKDKLLKISRYKDSSQVLPKVYSN